MASAMQAVGHHCRDWNSTCKYSFCLAGLQALALLGTLLLVAEQASAIRLFDTRHPLKRQVGRLRRRGDGKIVSWGGREGRARTRCCPPLPHQACCPTQLRSRCLMHLHLILLILLHCPLLPKTNCSGRRRLMWSTLAGLCLTLAMHTRRT
jgi:hypothetical protein